MTPDQVSSAVIYCRVPLRDRTGKAVAWACVDPSDLEGVASCRWYLSSRGYAARQYRDGRKVRGDGQQVDHINRDKLDNRRENLRLVTQAQNNQNITAGRGASGVHGVHWDSARGRWFARVQLNRRQHWLGHFDTVEEAAVVVAEWRRLNVPFSVEAAA